MGGTARRRTRAGRFGACRVGLATSRRLESPGCGVRQCPTSRRIAGRGHRAVLVARVSRHQRRLDWGRGHFHGGRHAVARKSCWA